MLTFHSTPFNLYINQISEVNEDKNHNDIAKGGFR